jgi:DNA/RNA-binding domain of Phe-tRNA-synthetase-like protein
LVVIKREGVKMGIFDKLFGKTKNVMLISCCVPGIERDTLIEAARLAGEYVRRFCVGVREITLFP